MQPKGGAVQLNSSVVLLHLFIPEITAGHTDLMRAVVDSPI